MREEGGPGNEATLVHYHICACHVVYQVERMATHMVSVSSNAGWLIECIISTFELHV